MGRDLQDVVKLQFDSPNALAALGATALSVVATWVLSKSSSVRTLFFWNGVMCLVSGLTSFYVAVTPSLELSWETGDVVFDELLGTSLDLLRAHVVIQQISHSCVTQITRSRSCSARARSCFSSCTRRCSC